MKKGNMFNGMKNAMVIVVSLLCLTGCTSGIQLQSTMQNVEQRDYATVLLIDRGKDGKNYEFSLGIAEEKKVGEKSQTEKLSTFYANDFEELAKEYQLTKGKSLSLVHLKVILLARDGNSAFEEQWDILHQMGENEEIAKTCPVLQITEKDKFTTFIEDAKEPVGTYLDNLIKVTDNQGQSIPQLKDYLKVLREEMYLPIYFLEKKSEGWQLKCRAEVTISES